MNTIKTYNIYENTDYKWTQDKNDCVPYIKMIEYENKTDNVVQEVIYLRKAKDLYGDDKNLGISVASGSFSDVYKNLYTVSPTSNIFKLPYLKPEGYTLDTTYSQIDPKASTLGGGFQQFWNNIVNLPNALKDQYDSVSALFGDSKTQTKARRQGTQLAKQSVKAYNGSNFGQYSTVFNLLNETEKLATNHLNFIQTMLLHNAPAFVSIMAIKVPYVYAIEISGLYKIPLGFISNFAARPKGNVIMLKGNYVPDVWEISMSFNSLIPISQQMLETSFYGTKLENNKKETDIANITNNMFRQI